MAGPATILREIHRLKRHVTDLQSEIERAPRLLKTQQARVARQEELAREAQESLKRLKVTYHEKEVLLKTNLQQITKHEKQLNEAGSKKEYDVLKAEILADRKKGGDVENEMLDILEQLETKTAQLPEADKAIQRAKAEYVDFEKSAQGREAGLKEQLDQARKDLAEVEAKLPSDVRPHYERLVASRGEDAMAAVHNRTCMACYTEITAQSYNDLMLSQFVLCKSCGRVLYLPE